MATLSALLVQKHYVLYPRQNLSLDRLRINVNENNKVFIALKLLKR